jgi:hypothetical protein
MQLAAGIGEHAQAVITLPCRVFGDFENLLLGPELLRFRFQDLGIVGVHKAMLMKKGEGYSTARGT